MKELELKRLNLMRKKQVSALAQCILILNNIESISKLSTYKHLQSMGDCAVGWLCKKGRGQSAVIPQPVAKLLQVIPPFQWLIFSARSSHFLSLLSIQTTPSASFGKISDMVTQFSVLEEPLKCMIESTAF